MQTYGHYWELSPHTSPSGKTLHHCPVCGLYDPAPVRVQYEFRRCEPGLWESVFRVEETGQAFPATIVRVIIAPLTEARGR